MKIAIIGAGNVGGTLGRGWAKKGHDIFFGVREPRRRTKSRKLLQSIGPKCASRHRQRCRSIRRDSRAGNAVAGDGGGRQ